MSKIVPHSILYTSMFYLKILEHRGPSLTISNSNGFENIWINKKVHCGSWADPPVASLLLCSERAVRVTSRVALLPPLASGAASPPRAHEWSFPRRWLLAPSPPFTVRPPHRPPLPPLTGALHSPFSCEAPRPSDVDHQNRLLAGALHHPKHRAIADRFSVSARAPLDAKWNRRRPLMPVVPPPHCQ
jgi:hypothetical protein